MSRDPAQPTSEFVDEVCKKTKACRDVNPEDLKDLKPPYKTSIDFGIPMSGDGEMQSWTVGGGSSTKTVKRESTEESAEGNE